MKSNLTDLISASSYFDKFPIIEAVFFELIYTCLIFPDYNSGNIVFSLGGSINSISYRKNIYYWKCVSKTIDFPKEIILPIGVYSLFGKINSSVNKLHKLNGL